MIIILDHTNRPIGGASQPEPFKVARPLGLPVKTNSNQFDYSTGHITSVKFEPLFSSDNSLLYGFKRAQPFTKNVGARRILVSHMYAPVFLYDLYSEESSYDCQLQVSLLFIVIF